MPLKREFVRTKTGILDETPDIENAIALCDAYIGDAGTSVTSDSLRILIWKDKQIFIIIVMNISLKSSPLNSIFGKFYFSDFFILNNQHILSIIRNHIDFAFDLHRS